ncbi:MAG: hypothetical protein MJZ60_05985, partial [Bacteroidaceae bacterium]|nr:hypothetical protein [Bacteroidaceae bacterium]
LTKMNELPISVKKTGYSTFYCPIDAQLQNGNAYIAKVNEEEARITFTKLSDGRIPKNTPVLIESEEARAQGQTVTVIAKLRTDGAEYTSVASGSNDLKGGYYTVSFMKSADHATYDAVIERKAVDTHTYTLQNGTWLYFVGTKLQGFKARFELKDVAGNGSMSGVKEYTFIFNDEETGETKVVDAFGESKTDDVIYNLSGQRVNKAQKGLYIMNGKKVLVK